MVDMLLVTCYRTLQAQLYKMWQVVEQKKKENAEMRKRIELEERMAALDRTLDVQVCSPCLGSCQQWGMYILLSCEEESGLDL